MKKLAIFAVLFCWVLAWPLYAGETSAAANAPAAEQPKANGEGCMPDGGCCGACAAARAQAATHGEEKQQGSDTTGAADAGGCPCKRAKQQTM